MPPHVILNGAERSEESHAASEHAEIPRSARNDMGLLVQQPPKTPLYSPRVIKGEGRGGS